MDKLSASTNEELKKVEHADILDASSLDRKWWTHPGKRFPDGKSRDEAVEKGDLVHVDVPNEYFTSPSDIRKNPNLQLLRPQTKNLLFSVCKDLDKATGYSRSGVRLAVTSMYRGDEVQNEIVNSSEWYRAAKVGTSAHAAGAAFDISIRSYYKMNNETGELNGINSWDEKSFLKYQPEIFEYLGEILSSYSENGACNVIVENVVEDDDYSPTCFHVCVSPDFADEMI